MWKENYYDMEKMFSQMDSLRNRFFNENYPGLIRPPEKKKYDADKIY
jgi:hypothetical protein